MDFVQHQQQPFERVGIDYVVTPRKCVQVILKL